MTAANPPTPATTPPSQRLASAASAGAGAGAAAGPSGAASSSKSAAGSSRPTRTSARSRRSVGGAVSSPASSAGPLTPADPNPPAVQLGSGIIAKSNIAPKVHGLRNAHTARERVPCPFPGEFGGPQHCGVLDEDLADDVLMAICGACATMVCPICRKVCHRSANVPQGNIALSPDELASIAFDNGWLRPPSVAVAPATMIQNAIRLHQSRCSKSSPARKPLVIKYQLSGSMAETALEPALHPQAFEGQSRPKGPVWYLSPDVGRAKWRNPFAGIVVPKAPVRKPNAPKQRSSKPASSKDSARGRGKKHRDSTPASTTDTSSAQPPPRIKLRLPAAAGDAASQQGDESDAPSYTPGESRDTSRSQTVDSTAAFPSSNPSTPPPNRRRQRQSVFDSSDSDSSSDDEAAPRTRPSQRRLVLPAMAAGAGHRFTQPQRMSPLGELFFSPLHTPSQLPQSLPNHSPFPCHSLDNTIWGARRSIDDEPIGFDTSSSEDEEMRDPDWGTGSGVIVKAEDEHLNAQLPEGMKQQEVEAKVDATTNAMSKLFPYDEPPATGAIFSELDNLGTSDTSSLTDSTAVAANLALQGKLKSATCSNVLPVWALSSPVQSPNMAGRPLPAFETSPTSFFRTARDWESRTMAMDVDMEHDESWLDESGQLPVHAEESFSDLEVGSTVGDMTTPERDRALHTAEWAQTTSALSMSIKQEPEDYYPSPAATSEHSSLLSEPSRESSVSTASSPLSELPDLDSDSNDEEYAQEVLIGPESVHIDELDDWLPAVAKSERTPGRGRVRNRQDPQRSSWGGIGVNNPFVPCPSTVGKLVPPPLVRKRSQRSTRRTRSTPRKAERITPAPSPTEVVVINLSPRAEPADVLEPPSSDDMELDDAIGTAELEKAAAEAIAREEQHRARKRAAAEKQQREWEECLRTFANACPEASTSTDSGSASPEEAVPSSVCASAQSSPWSEVSSHWGSTESISDMAPHQTTLSPLALQMTPIVPAADIAVMAMLAKASGPDAMALDFTQEDIEAMAAQLSPPPAPPPLPAAPAPPSAASNHRSPPKRVLNIAPRPGGAPGALKPLKPKPSLEVDKDKADKLADKPKPTKSASLPAPKASPSIAPAPALAPADAPAPPTPAPLKAPASAPASPAPAQATTPAPAPAASPVTAVPTAPLPAPIPQTAPPAAPATLAPAPAATPMAAPAPTLPTSTDSSAAPSQAPSQLTSQVPSQAPSQVPTRTVSPVARTTTASPTGSTVSSSTSVSTPTSTSSTQSRPGGTTKRLLPGIDACVVDNLPCYSHIWDNPKGGRCTVLRRLDTDFVNGTALLTALGVAPARQPEHLNTPSPTLASHRTVPLISPQGLHHAPGVPGVWVPLVEARSLAAKLGLQDDAKSLLANILREDLFQLFKALAGISLRHTSSTESFGMPFVTQPLGQRGKVAARPPPARPVPNAVQANSKPALVRTSTQQPDGCPQPKRRRSTVAVPGATGPQVMQQTTVPNVAPSPPSQATPSPAPPVARKTTTSSKAVPSPQPPMTRAQQAKSTPTPLARRTRASFSGSK